MRASLEAVAKACSSGSTIHLAAPGQNLVAGGVKGLGGVGTVGFGLRVDDKLHHHAHL